MRTTFWTRLLDVVAPRVCAVCGARLTAGERVLCAVCHLHLPLTGYEHSPLSNPLARLFWGHFPVEHAAALFFFEPHSATSQMIYDMKYRSMPETAQALGAIAARQFAAAGFFTGIDAVVPVPVTRLRKWQRGYNQSMEIALGIKEVTELPIYNNVLKRIHFKASQTTMNAQQRKFNVEGAFALTNPGLIAHKHILLVDDIVTTGSTLIACGRELSKAPGVRISILTLGMTKT